MPHPREQPPTGQVALVLGNGPSIDSVPRTFWSALRKVDGLMIVGTNRCLAFAALRRAPLHALVIRDTYRNLWHDPLWGILYHEELWKPCPAWKVGPADRRVTHCDQFLRFEGPWQERIVLDENRETAVLANSSVCLMAANWAFLQGCRRIYFLGLDYCAGRPRMIRPYDRAEDGWQGRYDRPPPPSVEEQFATAARALRDLGGHMWNLSPQTRLQAVAATHHTHLTGSPCESESSATTATSRTRTSRSRR